MSQHIAVHNIRIEAKNLMELMYLNKNIPILTFKGSNIDISKRKNCIIITANNFLLYCDEIKEQIIGEYFASK